MTSQEERSDALDYEGRDLEAMASADNYHRWIAEVFRPFLGLNVIELGAGSGNFSEFLCDAMAPDAHLTLIEPSVSMFRILQRRFENRPRVRCLNATLEGAVAGHELGDADTLISISVLEHIEDDVGMLAEIGKVLRSDGALCLYVPALPALYGAHDRSVGHFRRYTRRSLTEAVRATGVFTAETCNYMDILGVVPWLIMTRLFRKTLSRGPAGSYDRFGVPLTRAIERIFHPPVGKNLYLVARRT